MAALKMRVTLQGKIKSWLIDWRCRSGGPVWLLRTIIITKNTVVKETNNLAFSRTRMKELEKNALSTKICPGYSRTENFWCPWSFVWVKTSESTVPNMLKRKNPNEALSPTQSPDNQPEALILLTLWKENSLLEYTVI